MEITAWEKNPPDISQVYMQPFFIPIEDPRSTVYMWPVPIWCLLVPLHLIRTAVLQTCENSLHHMTSPQNPHTLCCQQSSFYNFVHWLVKQRVGGVISTFVVVLFILLVASLQSSLFDLSRLCRIFHGQNVGWQLCVSSLARQNFWLVWGKEYATRVKLNEIPFGFGLFIVYYICYRCLFGAFLFGLRF